MESKARVSPISAANYLGSRCAEVISGYRYSVNVLPMSDDNSIRIIMRIVEYDLFECIIDRHLWDYTLLTKEYNRILDSIQMALRESNWIYELHAGAKRSVDVILNLNHI